MGDDLAPDDRRRSPAISGTPVRLGGHDWLFADAIPGLGPVWDRLWDANVASGRYDGPDLQLASAKLLHVNYALTSDETVQLVLSARVADLVEPVEIALFGPDREYRGYSDWARSALLANGLSPASVPPGDLRAVLDQLVATGRAVPAAAWCSSASAATKRKRLLDAMRGS